MKGKVLNAVFNAVLVILLIVCVYGVICRIGNKPLSLGGYQLYVIQSGSMEPELHKYDLTLVKAVDASELREGDIVTYRRSDGLVVTHRIVEVTETGLVTRGDANTGNDSPILFSAVYGKNIGKVRYIGAVFSFFQSGYGVALLVIVLVIYCFKDKIGKLLLKEDPAPPSTDSPSRDLPSSDLSLPDGPSETEISDNKKDE